MSNMQPLAPSGDGEPRPEVIDRDPLGRFAPGNRGGRGNPMAARVAALRSVLLDAVTPADLVAVVAALIDRAKAGDVPAIREVLDRAVGKAVLPVDVAVGMELDATAIVIDDDMRATMNMLLTDPTTREALILASEAAIDRAQELRLSRG